MASLSVTITLFGPEPIIDELYSHNDISDVDMDEPQTERGLADAVDAPIGPQEIEEFLQLLTVAIGTATSAVILIQKIKNLLKKSGAKNKVVQIRNPKTNRLIGEVGADTDVDKLADSLMAESG
jgi:hypothetical protein